jgi:hypothetical protein
MGSQRRHKRGFERVGELRPEELGLPPKKSRELSLAAAWRRAAGEAIADRVAAVRIARGTLEIRVDPAHTSWAHTIFELLPLIAGRLARGHPGLGVRKARLLAESAGSGFPDIVVRPSSSEVPYAGSGLPSRRPQPDEPVATATPSCQPVGDTDPADRLRKLAELYLERMDTDDQKP